MLHFATGCLACGQFFSCIVVYQFAMSLTDDCYYAKNQDVENGKMSGSVALPTMARVPSPPPTYDTAMANV